MTDLPQQVKQLLDDPQRSGLNQPGLNQPGLNQWSAASRGTNLPSRMTSFVGRESEIAALHECLSTARLVTLLGPAGCGKTRLGIEAAARVPSSTYAGGVWLVELAGISYPELVSQTVAGVLGLTEGAAQSLSNRLIEYLRERRVLLLVDNCEHLVDACADLAETLLRNCPELTILATSREALGIIGEMAWQVPGLGMPDPAQAATPDELAECEAVQLFAQRARAHDRHFELNASNVKSVERVCRQLDGMPLALELAALHQLVAASLVAAREQSAGTRYLLLETLRGYARERLKQHRELESILGQHARYYADLAERASRELYRGRRQREWPDTHRHLHADTGLTEVLPPDPRLTIQLAAGLLNAWLARHIRLSVADLAHASSSGSGKASSIGHRKSLSV